MHPTTYGTTYGRRHSCTASPYATYDLRAAHAATTSARPPAHSADTDPASRYYRAFVRHAATATAATHSRS